MCNHSELISFSCKRRGICPSCDAKRAAVFAENLVEHVLLPYEHRHVTFTVPKRVRPYFKFDRTLNSILYDAAWESWKELILEQGPNGTAAAVAALHSAGDLLGFYPHIHSMNLAGAILPDGTFKAVHVEQKRCEALFAQKVLKALKDKGLLSQEDIDNMNSWEHSGFSVFIGEPIAPADKSQLLYTARYLRKCPISNERLSINEQGPEPIIQYSSSKQGSTETRTFSPLEFLAVCPGPVEGSYSSISRIPGFGVSVRLSSRRSLSRTGADQQVAGGVQRTLQGSRCRARPRPQHQHRAGSRAFRL